jgi:hypothetical protein
MENCNEELSSDHLNDCSNYFKMKSPFLFSIDVMKEMYLAVKEEGYEDAAMLRDGIIPEHIHHKNVKSYFKPIIISTNDIFGTFDE